jgi:hypothetical protein
MRVAAVGVVIALALGPLTAHAQDGGTPDGGLFSCEDDVNVGPNRVYIQAADTQVPLLKTLGKQLRAQTTPITIVYSPNGSCSNISYLYNGVFTPNATAGGTFFIPAGSSFNPATSTVPNCTLGDAGHAPDLAISIVFPDSTDCPTAPARPSTVGVTQGPVQAMVFAVPGGVGTTAGSSQTTLTAEEAYLVMGLGAANAQVSPWTDPNFIFGRPPTKGTQISIGANIDVPAAKWQLLNDTQHQINQSPTMASTLASHVSDGNAEKTLGILGTEIYDQTTNRAQLHSLAFRAFKQYHSYWPDSTPSSFDKRNVRDGHYPLWSYVQYLYPLAAGGNNQALNPNAQEIVDLMVGNPVTTNPVFEPLDLVIGAGLVPVCAMGVSRTAEGGPEALYSPAQPCGCHFNATVPAGSTSCTACPAGTCATGVCRHGYCEAQ